MIKKNDEQKIIKIKKKGEKMVDYSTVEIVSENTPFVVAFYKSHYEIIAVRDHAEFNPSGNEIAVLETNKHGTQKSILEFHCGSILKIREIEKIAERIDPFHEIENIYM